MRTRVEISSVLLPRPEVLFGFPDELSLVRGAASEEIWNLHGNSSFWNLLCSVLLFYHTGVIFCNVLCLSLN